MRRHDPVRAFFHLAGALLFLTGAGVVLWLVFFQFGTTDATDTAMYDSYINGRYADMIELPEDQSTAVGHSLVSFLAAPLLLAAGGLVWVLFDRAYDAVGVFKLAGGILAGSAVLIMPLMYLYQEEGLSFALDSHVTVWIPFGITVVVLVLGAWARMKGARALSR